MCTGFLVASRGSSISARHRPSCDCSFPAVCEQPWTLLMCSPATATVQALVCVSVLHPTQKLLAHLTRRKLRKHDLVGRVKRPEHCVNCRCRVALSINVLSLTRCPSHLIHPGCLSRRSLATTGLPLPHAIQAGLLPALSSHRRRLNTEQGDAQRAAFLASLDTSPATTIWCCSVFCMVLLGEASSEAKKATCCASTCSVFKRLWCDESADQHAHHHHLLCCSHSESHH